MLLVDAAQCRDPQRGVFGQLLEHAGSWRVLFAGRTLVAHQIIPAEQVHKGDFHIAPTYAAQSASPKYFFLSSSMYPLSVSRSSDSLIVLRSLLPSCSPIP